MYREISNIVQISQGNFCDSQTRKPQPISLEVTAEATNSPIPPLLNIRPLTSGENDNGFPVSNTRNTANLKHSTRTVPPTETHWLSETRYNTLAGGARHRAGQPCLLHVNILTESTTP